jgi:hypothetical protein
LAADDYSCSIAALMIAGSPLGKKSEKAMKFILDSAFTGAQSSFER